MCKVKKPSYTPSASTARQARVAREQKPNQSALYEQARQRAAESSGGRARSTVLSGLQGDTSTPIITNRNRGQRPVLS